MRFLVFIFITAALLCSVVLSSSANDDMLSDGLNEPAIADDFSDIKDLAMFLNNDDDDDFAKDYDTETDNGVYSEDDGQDVVVNRRRRRFHKCHKKTVIFWTYTVCVDASCWGKEVTVQASVNEDILFTEHFSVTQNRFDKCTTYNGFEGCLHLKDITENEGAKQVSFQANAEVKDVGYEGNFGRVTLDC